MYHFIADWLFQPNDWTERKFEETKILLLHSFLYTAIMAIPLMSYDNSLLTISIILITHLVIDSRKLTEWWLKNVMKVKETSYIYVMLVDQIFHIIIIYMIWRYLI